MHVQYLIWLTLDIYFLFQVVTVCRHRVYVSILVNTNIGRVLRAYVSVLIQEEKKKTKCAYIFIYPWMDIYKYLFPLLSIFAEFFFFLQAPLQPKACVEIIIEIIN